MCLCRPARFSGKNINRVTHVYVALHNVCITLSGNYLIKKCDGRTWWLHHWFCCHGHFNLQCLQIFKKPKHVKHTLESASLLTKFHGNLLSVLWTVSMYHYVSYRVILGITFFISYNTVQYNNKLVFFLLIFCF